MSDLPASFSIFADLLRVEAGMLLRPQKAYLLEARLQPLMRREEADSLDALAVLLCKGPGTRQEALRGDIVEAMLNHETYFFRDRLPFEALMTTGFPKLRESRRASRRLRVWSAACSNGQEPYSLAIMLEETRSEWSGWTVDILASDISEAALDRAREGSYTHFEVQRGLSVQRLMAHFTKSETLWRISPALRKAVRFERRNLCVPPPPGERFDLILARNVLMYLDAERRAAALAHLHGALAPDGLLLLGAAETVLGHSDAFVASPDCKGFYTPVTREDRFLHNRRTAARPSAA